MTATGATTAGADSIQTDPGKDGAEALQSVQSEFAAGRLSFVLNRAYYACFSSVFYDRVFENRQRGDYQELVSFEVEQVAEIIEQSREFVNEMGRLLSAVHQ